MARVKRRLGSLTEHDYEAIHDSAKLDCSESRGARWKKGLRICEKGVDEAISLMKSLPMTSAGHAIELTRELAAACRLKKHRGGEFFACFYGGRRVLTMAADTLRGRGKK